MRVKATRYFSRFALILSVVFIAILLVMLPTSRSIAQPGSAFGKNKVQYKNFDWKFIQSPHFDIYFYQGGRDLAEFCAEQAESSLESIEHTVRYDITNRIAILCYNSHNDFQQTNAVGEFLPEGVGGVTELLKNRVVLPFEGNYELFRHVIHHELVHAVINDMFIGGTYQALLTGGGMMIPSWMNEGLAEYESLRGLDIETDMFMRDATLNEAVPPLERLGGYVQYRVGQTMYWYISQKYGPEKVAELLQRIKTSRSIEIGFRTTFGLTVGEFSERYIQALKVLYYPDIARFEEPMNYAEVLADHKKLENFINASPEVSPQGDLVAFISDRNDYYDVYVQSLSKPKDIKRVLSGGGATGNFEELHLLTPGLSWSPDGKRLALAAKSGEKDAVYLIDVNTSEQEKLPDFDLDAIQQVKWSPDGKKLAFAGVKSGASDIYVYDFTTKTVTNLTLDLFNDRDPDWTGDSRSIYFVSERDNHLVPGEYPTSRAASLNYIAKSKDIYCFHLDSNSIERITDTPDADEIYPAVAHDNSALFFISNKNGINNIWTSTLKGEKARPLTNSVSKIDQISISNDASKLAFSAMHKGGYDMFLLRNPSDRHIDSLPMTEFRKSASGRMMSRLDTLTSDRQHASTSGDSARGYGGVHVDLHDYVFGSNPEQERSMHDYHSTRPLETITNYKDSSGHYIVHDYKVVFSPDVILGTAGYTGYYGLQGTTQMLFSDELGNHQLFFGTNLILDLKNSDYILAYYNLEHRNNWGLTGFHTAQFLTVPNDQNDPNNQYAIARFTSYGLTGTVSYPFDRFNRLDVGASAMVLERDLIDYNTPTKRKFTVFPQLTYIHDDVLWSYFYPKAGARYNIGISAAPKLGNNWLGFVTPSADLRYYIKLTSDFSIATRFAGAASFGPTPQKFFIGGVDGWVNRFFKTEVFPLNEPEDYAFFSSGRPVRGFAYNEKEGTKYLLGNIEIRYPFPIIVAGFPLAFFGDSFIDAGTAWTDQVYPFQKASDGTITTRDLLLSTGTGVRTYLFGFYVHFDIAWTTNLSAWSHPNYIVSIGEDF
jgi:Tol biopolymer transport system component